MQLRIDGLEMKEIETKNGLSTLLKIKSGNETYSAFRGKWNADWQVGQTVECRVEISGKYKNLKPADGAILKGSDMAHKLSDLEVRVTRLENLLAQRVVEKPSRIGVPLAVAPTPKPSGPPIFKQPIDEPPPFTDEDCPF